MIDAKDTRREVAERLRAKHRERNAPGMFEAQDLGLQVMSYLKDLESCLPDGDSAFAVIADLIDPTCNILSGDEGNHAMHCSVCGCAFLGLRYCSGCGARVVE
ncbi:MAG: hypothetical protein SOW20_07830 [Berryella intestinalis]|uniref:hypothetical protein n=1 Tax=Berryella intestinalis TaxID=1531429 RepID=UPI002A75B871|nr:hypothetical protein [Berryella intestinalis]MDY3129913.1 hypothetical protein [Berryella intestinalis]